MTVNKLLQKLFGKKSDDFSKVPVVSEELVRSRKEEWEYSEWLSTGKYRNYIDNLQQNLQLRKEGLQPSMDVYLHQSPSANGFFFCNRGDFGNKCMGYMFEYFKDKMLDANYFLQNKSREYEEEPDRVKTTEMYVLKPSQRGRKEGETLKHYGNVTLEYVLIDDKPSYLKVMSNTYNDRSHIEILPFEEFLDHLLKY